MMNQHQKSVIDQFTRQAAPFSKSFGHQNEESLRLLMELAEVTDKDTVLDIACGTGMVACAFARVALHVSGIDLTPAMLEQARLLAERQGLTNLSCYEGDIEKLPFADNTFSIVLSRYAFHHFVNPCVVVAEMARVCCPNGRILIADACPPPDKADAFNQFEKLFDPSHNRALSIDEFQSLLSDAKLKNVRLATYKMEMELESHIAASFPNPGDDEKIRQLFRADIGVDGLGVGAHLRDNQIIYAYPVTVFVAEKVGRTVLQQTQQFIAF